MFSYLHASVISIAYVLLLFAIAYTSDKIPAAYLRKFKPLIIGLCLPIYFTAWTFYGTSAQTLDKGWYMPPTFMGAALLIGTLIIFIRRLIKLGKMQRSTSIAGFLSSQYGNSRSIGPLVTLIAVIGILPYLSIQLQAMAMSFDLFTGGQDPATVLIRQGSIWQDTTLIIALLIALFSIIFGTRHIDLTEHQNGLMVAVAFQSLVKLIAIVAIGYYAGYVLHDGPAKLFQEMLASPPLLERLDSQTEDGYLTATILGMLVIVCLPKLFHVFVVESNDPHDADTSQWLFPFYTLILAFFILLIIFAGALALQGHPLQTDMYLLALPLAKENAALTLLSYIGGLSAVTSMAIVATVTLSTMVCNDLIVPLLLRNQRFYEKASGVGATLLNIRRAAIIAILLLTYAFYRAVGTHINLGALGLVSLSLIAQLAPALIAALYWNNRHSRGVIAGVVTGSLIWGYTILTPAIVQAGWITSDLLQSGLFGVNWLRPEALFGLDGIDPLSHGVIWSLGLNTLMFITVSYWYQQRLSQPQEELPEGVLSNYVLLHLAARFLGETQARLVFDKHFSVHDLDSSLAAPATSETIQFTKSLLSGIIGPSSARHMINLARTNRGATMGDGDTFIEEASQVLKFSRELLQSSIDNMNQGITVIDNNQRLVAWNKRCVELFNFPERLFYLGGPIEELILHNTRQENIEESLIASEVKERMEHFSKGVPFVYQRNLPNSRVVEVRGEPIPGRGYVTTYTDITDFKRMVDALTKSNETLEQRVTNRTKELEQAKALAEAANQSKTRFLAAASHDLAQPLNASRLFITALQHLELENDPRELVNNLSDSLQNAENLITELFDIAKIDAGTIKKSISSFPVSQVLDSLGKDFTILAQDSDVDFRYHNCNLAVRTDKKLLRRILQNILANALRYTPEGRVVMGCRRLKDCIRIEIWDTGIGIPEENLNDIFTEFKRLSSKGAEEGMGLGLATVHRLCRLLELPINVRSAVGKGSAFTITLPRSSNADSKSLPNPQTSQPAPKTQGKSLNILCIDNEAAILTGMEAMLSKWGHKVTCCRSLKEAQQQFSTEDYPDTVLADYHLDNDETGIEAVTALFAEWETEVPCVIISADQTERVRTQAKELGFLFQQKPVKPHILRAALSRFAAQGRHGNRK